MKSLILTWLLIGVASIVFAGNAVVKGRVLDEQNSPVVGAHIFVKGTNKGVSSDADGKFKLQVQEGKIVLVVSMLGYLKTEQELNLQANEEREINVVLKENNLTLGEVEIVGKSAVREVEESGFNAVAIDAKPFHNASVSMSQVLDRAPGVKIQQDGGLGSRTNVTINGLSGRHVRFFIDGMPMDAMSSAFQINNLPINLAERIEIYKGVVPVNFGSDALGGAVNIVTKKSAGKYIDFSYSYGSFNTHQTYLNAGYTSKKGFTAQISAFQNYSDNDYYVDATIKNFETNLLSKETQRVRRFHDVYHNETVIAKVGLVNQKFADQLLFGITYGEEYDEIQHPAYLNLAFGEKYQTSTIIMPSFLYSKKNLIVKGLDFSFAANYNLGGGHNYDLSDKEYNWLGEWEYSNSPGEMVYSDYEYKDNNGTINANANYQVTTKHRLTVNDVATFFARQGDEKTAVDDLINQEPRVNNRNILGASINSKWTDNLSTSLFGKMYSYKASAFLDLSNSSESAFETVSKSDSKFGYGFTAAYFLFKNLQVKGSYELTCRLPESTELFGEVFGFYLANFDLKPEQSNNYNLGLNYTFKLTQNHVFNLDANAFYRQTFDYIRLNISYSQGEGSYENTELVITPGVDAELRYSFKDKIAAGASVSYLKPTNYTEGSTYYEAIMPNQPNFYANFNASYFLKKAWMGTGKLSFSYNLQFINEFLYDYDTYKASNRATIPTQWNHSVFANYSWKEGKFNVSVDCKNLLDANLYDNYSLQKPGRSYSVKFRYYFNKY